MSSLPKRDDDSADGGGGGGTKRPLKDNADDGVDQVQETSDDQNTTNSKKRRLDEAKVGVVATTTASLSSSTATSVASCPTSTLYVSNLHQRISEPHLEKLFQRFGDINRVHLIRKITSSGGDGIGSSSIHRSKGGMSRHKQHQRQQQQQRAYSYAFVEFKSIQSASTAMTKLNGVSLLGRDLVVRPAHGKSQSETCSTGNAEGTSEDGVSVGLGGTANTRKQKNDVESKIDAVKRALQEKMKRRMRPNDNK